MINYGGDDVTRPWSLRLLAGLLAGLLGGATLAGCSQGQEASGSLPTSTAAPTTTEQELPPLGPEDLPMPAEARTPDAAGAEAFVRYYIELINRTSVVMDAEPLREFSDGCDECQRLARNTDEAAAAGHDYEDGTISIIEVGSPLLERDTAEMALRLDQEAFRVVDGSGQLVQGSEAYSNISCGVALRWDNSRETWAMTQLTFS